MVFKGKAIHSQDQDQQLNLSRNEDHLMSDNVKPYQKCPHQKKPNGTQVNLCVIILICLFVVSSAVISYRYVQMPLKQEGVLLNPPEERKVQTIISSQIAQNIQGQVKSYDQMLRMQMEKTQKSEVLQQLITQQSQKQLQNTQVNSQRQVQQTTQRFTHQEEPQESTLQKLQQDQGQISQEQTTSQANEQSQEVELQKNSKSVQLQQLLADKSAQNLILDSVAKQIQQRKEQQSGKLQQMHKDSGETVDQMKQAETEVPAKSDVIEKLSAGLQQRKQQPAQSALSPESTPSEKKALTSSGTILSQGSPQISQMDLFDPIIRVKNDMQKRFNQKFQDLIYIKAGTKVNQSQYYAAKQRMNLWKYFNVKTRELQLLDDVKYEAQADGQLSVHRMQKIMFEEQLQYEKKYRVSQYKQIGFCIIIPSFKNNDKYFRNLNSILQQDYDNYHIIYIDDASKDGTADRVREYVRKYQVPESRLNFIENQVNKKALPNIDYAARNLCRSGQIMAIIDGDDYLIGSQVFKIINARYQSQNLLALYTNHLRVHEPIYLKVGTCIEYPERVKKMRSYRRFSIFPASHLRTFYVDLYWRINMRDLRDHKGQYFTAANDFAIMMPILQMASERFEYLPQITYIYDAGTGYNNFQTKTDVQARNFKTTKRRHKYPKIVHELQFQKVLKQKGIIQSRPQQSPKEPQITKNTKIPQVRTPNHRQK